jgi:hypothetical protein
MGYVKFKKIYYFMINTEYSGPDLGLATRDPDIRTCDLGEPFFLSLLYVVLIWAASFILFHIVRWNVTEHYWAGLTFSLILFVTSFNHAMNLLQNTVVAINKQTHCFILPCSMTIAAAVF